MPLSTKKRRFLAAVIGEEKTLNLEKFLSSQREKLEEMGVQWKQGPTSFEALAVEQKFNVLCDQLIAIVENVLSSPDLTVEQKREAVQQAASDFGAELERVGIDTGEKSPTSKSRESGSPVADYLQMLSVPQPSTQGAAAVKALGESRHPIAPYFGQLVELVGQQGG